MNIISRVITKGSYWALRINQSLFFKVYVFISGLVKSPKHFKKKIVLLPTGDPLIGKKLTEGNYFFAGVLLDPELQNPWLINSPSLEVESFLQGFYWLNDLAAIGTYRAKSLAISWTNKWHEHSFITQKVSWDPEITALRSVNFLRNWDLLKDSSQERTNQYLINIRQQYFYLYAAEKKLVANLAKIRVLHALFLLSVAYQDSSRRKKKISHKLCKNILKCIDKQGHISSRNPEELSEYFFIINEVINNSENLISISEYNYLILNALKIKIAPILRGLRLGNGFLIRSHGGDFGSVALIDKYLVQSDVKKGPSSTNLMGFERITAGRLTLLVDCAKPAENLDSFNAHASCLSFELTSGQRPIFVHCGPGGRFGTAFKRYCRATQAHNSCTLDSVSQVQFEIISRNERWPDEFLLSGPKNVTMERQKTLDATWLSLSHDSFEERYGYVHYRKLLMLNSGKVFTGTDSFKINKKEKKRKRARNFYAHFQLHPDVELWDHPRLQTIVLRLKNGEHWIFEIDLGQVTVEESTYINTVKGVPQNTKRIVIKSPALYNSAEIKWSLRRREIVSRNTRDLEITH